LKKPESKGLWIILEDIPKLFWSDQGNHKNFCSGQLATMLKFRNSI